MIPKQEEQHTVSRGVAESTSFEISSEDTAHIMTILRDTLYSNKILAVIREYTSNAWDANRMAGRADVPVRIHVPTLSDMNLRIRDVGPGLSPDEIRRIFTKYGASTKRESNEAVGMLGIGSKSGFAYSDSFTVTSWTGGRRRVYIAVIDESQKGRIDLMHEEDCDPSETGVEIEIPVRAPDIAQFHNEARGFLQYLRPLPEVNLSPALQTASVGETVEGLGMIAVPEDYSRRGTWTAIMGCVPYRIDLRQLDSSTGRKEYVSQTAFVLTGVVNFDIGDLQVAASREDLKYGDSTKDVLVAKINGVIDEFIRRKLEGIDQLNNWEKRQRLLTLHRMNIPLPKGMADMATTYVDFRRKDMGIRLLQVYDRHHAANETTYIAIDPATRFLIRDDTRTIKGFELGYKDLVVAPPVYPKGTARENLTPADLRRRLAKLMAELKIEGAPVANLSSVKWNAPTQRQTPRDNSRARANVLVYQGGSLDGRHSLLWNPTTHTPKDDDVYVVLESYRVDGQGDDFYWTLERDKRLVESVGLKFPTIVGYKRTKTNQVDRAKLKGTEYSEWRKKGLAELLAKEPKVLEAAQLVEYARATSNSYSISYDKVKAKLGETHHVSKFIQKVMQAHTALGKVADYIKNAGERVRTDLQDRMEAAKERGMIFTSYPMFHTSGDLSVLARSDRDIWLDYILMVDGYRTLREGQGKETKAA